MIDQIISHYRILEKLGAGGMGVVYKAQDTRLDRFVALKFLPDNAAQDAHALERFRREAHAASALNHPGICTIYDIGDQGHQPFIAMEFIDGETLSHHIHGTPLPTEEILELGIQIADALDVAHGEGIIHRDIKPSNVFVTRRGQAKVLDFGLAKLIPKDLSQQSTVDSGSAGSAPSRGSQEPISMVGVISGTPSYMSPEQIRGDDLDPRTDIFALGLLLYEMATGQKAFSGRTAGAVIEALLTKTPNPVHILNPQIPVRLEEIINKCLEKDRDLRYAGAAAVRNELQMLKRETESGTATITRPIIIQAPPATVPPKRIGTKMIAAAAVLLLAATAVGAWIYSNRRVHALGQMDTLVLADFNNKTGDAIFDETLRQGLAAQLQQSPFLSLVSEQRIQETLRLMGRPSDGKIPVNIAGDLCQRVGSKAYLSGSIAAMGSQYVIGVNAVNCQTGEYLARLQSTANGKENVLKALGEVSTELRENLGESLKTVKKLDTPIEQATTPSLEALQAYGMGRKALMINGDYTAAVPLFKRSIQLDPKFAMAYASLGTAYNNLGEKTLSAENTAKSFALREKVSEWEKFYIESHYYHFGNGDLEKARETYELWSKIYPREEVAVLNLGVLYQALGQYEKAVQQFRDALRLAPSSGLDWGNLVFANINLKRLKEARSIADEALQKGLDSGDLRLYLYELAFINDNKLGMVEQVDWSLGKPGHENVMLFLESGTAAYAGKLAKARELSDQATRSAEQANEKEMAAGCEAAAALREALFGNPAEARTHAAQTVALSHGKDAQFMAALALAIVGDAARSEALAGDLQKRFPEDTIVRFNYLPTLRAQNALNTAANGAKSIEELTVAAPYELGLAGSSTFWTNMYPVYVRGEAFLAAHQGAQAAAEFQKILNWPGVVFNEPIGALAQLEIARAYAMAGDTAKSRAAYKNFLELWKDADADIPVFKEAQAESAKLQ
jgi:eukaryotic-like serine/threonine-protein kinase